MSEPATENIAPVKSRVIPGQFLVVSLLFLGIAATAFMFVYFEQHSRPFRSLREAIGREFRHSRPNVEGGRNKGRGPKTLRITMSVEFPPAEDTANADQVVARVHEIIRKHTDVNEFEKVDVNLVQFVPQEMAKVKTFTWIPAQDKSPAGTESR